MDNNNLYERLKSRSDKKISSSLPNAEPQNMETSKIDPKPNINPGSNTPPSFEQNNKEEKVSRNFPKWRMKTFGAVCIVAAISSFSLMSSSTVNVSEAAKNALQTKVSTEVSAGVVLLSKDETIEAKDHTVTHQSGNNETQIWVWDYAAEDGDYVQVLVNGAPLSDAFMIKHKPRTFTVPAVGSVQIKGIRDGGGGITYAVRYDVNGATYFNSAPEGKFNTYTLVRE